MRPMSLTQLHIDSPCPANWDTMCAVEGGRYCEICEKIVHDIAQLSNLETGYLLDRAQSERICIRVRYDADNKPITKDRSKRIAAGQAFEESIGLSSADKHETPANSQGSAKECAVMGIITPLARN